MTDNIRNNHSTPGGVVRNPYLPSRPPPHQQHDPSALVPRNATTVTVGATLNSNSNNNNNNTDVAACTSSSKVVAAVTPSVSRDPVGHHCMACDNSGTTGSSTSVLGKRVRAVARTDLSMSESYHSPVSKAVKTCNTKVAGLSYDNGDDDDDDGKLQHLFGNPDIYGENKYPKKSRGPPTGDRPLVSIKRIYRKGPVQTKMCQYMYCKHPTKIVAGSPSSPSSSHISVNPLHVREDESDALADLRGFRVGVDGDKVPPHYCNFCRCPPTMCHDKLLGKVVELKVVDWIHGAEHDPTFADVEELFCEIYNDALRQKVCEKTGTLDLDSWEVPHCLAANSLNRLRRYFEACEYHYQMHKDITVGRGKPRNEQWKMFGNTTK
jgi:hypothetical protein